MRVEYIRLHAAVGTVYKAIPGMEVTTGEVGDLAQLGNILKELDDVETIAGDSGYLSHRTAS